MLWANASTIATIGGVVLALIVHLIGGIWKLSRVESAIMAALTTHKQETDDEFSKVRLEVGETIAALRHKVYELELWGRDNFVRREGFYKVRDELNESIRDLGEKLAARLDRMETKIDSKT